MATKTEWIPVDDGDINTWVSAENNGRHIGVYVDDDRYAEEDLPEGYALCRLVTVQIPDAGGVAGGLPMPDGPGWFAYEDHVGQWVAQLTKWEVANDTVTFRFASWSIPHDTRAIWQFKTIYPGTFYRLTMPWESQAQPAPSVSYEMDVDEALALVNMALRSSETFVRHAVSVLNKWRKEQQPAPVVAVPDGAAPAVGDWEDVPDMAHWDEDGKVKIEVVRGLDRRLYVKLDDGTKSIECVWPRKWRIQRQARPQPPQEPTQP